MRPTPWNWSVRSILIVPLRYIAPVGKYKTIASTLPQYNTGCRPNSLMPKKAERLLYSDRITRDTKKDSKI